MTNLVFCQNSKNTFFDDFLRSTPSVFKILGLIFRSFMSQNFSLKRNQCFDVPWNHNFLLIVKWLSNNWLAKNKRSQNFCVSVFTKIFLFGFSVATLFIEEISGAVNALLDIFLVSQTRIDFLKKITISKNFLDVNLIVVVNQHLCFQRCLIVKLHKRFWPTTLKGQSIQKLLLLFGVSCIFVGLL